MKKNTHLLWPVAIALCTIFASCKKDKEKEATLPPATQTGANTFGCYINGKLYIPQGFEQNRSNFEMIVDPGFNDGSIVIKTFNKANGNSSINFSLGSDSIRGLGFFPSTSRTGFVYTIYNTGGNICQTISQYENSIAGFLKITRYDLQNKIISGEFEFHFSNPNCGIGDPINITQGRFDKKF